MRRKQSRALVRPLHPAGLALGVGVLLASCASDECSEFCEQQAECVVQSGYPHGYTPLPDGLSCAASSEAVDACASECRSQRNQVLEQESYTPEACMSCLASCIPIDCREECGDSHTFGELADDALDGSVDCWGGVDRPDRTCPKPAEVALSVVGPDVPNHSNPAGNLSFDGPVWVSSDSGLVLTSSSGAEYTFTVAAGSLPSLTAGAQLTMSLQAWCRWWCNTVVELRDDRGRLVFAAWAIATLGGPPSEPPQIDELPLTYEPEACLAGHVEYSGFVSLALVTADGTAIGAGETKRHGDFEIYNGPTRAHFSNLGYDVSDGWEDASIVRVTE